jgi:hypothetical protein
MVVSMAFEESTPKVAPLLCVVVRRWCVCLSEERKNWAPRPLKSPDRGYERG